MPEYGEVLYNVTTAYVAALDENTNTYGTPARVEYLEEFEFEFEADEDEIKDGGMVVDMLSITTKATGQMRNASLNWSAMSILYGFTGHSYGSEPEDEYSEMDFQVGGAGNAHFGIIFRIEAKNGANGLIGFPKCMMSGLPPFQMQQNQFRRAEMDWSAMAPNPDNRKIMRIRRHRVAANVPTTDNGFDDFFSGYFS